ETYKVQYPAVIGIAEFIVLTSFLVFVYISPIFFVIFLYKIIVGSINVRRCLIKIKNYKFYMIVLNRIPLHTFMVYFSSVLLWIMYLTKPVDVSNALPLPIILPLEKINPFYMILGYWLLNKRCEYQLHQYLYPVMRGSSHDGRIYALPEELFIWNRNRSQKIGKWKRDRRYNTTTDLVEAQIGYSKFPFFLLATKWSVDPYDQNWTIGEKAYLTSRWK
ncbi:TPA: hypothetical protein ACL6BU_000337, partial [Streptococcus pneumoniae]